MTIEYRYAPPPASAARRRHTLPSAEFDSLAQGFGSTDAVRELAGTERSWRLAAMRGLLRELGDRGYDAGPLTAATEAWKLLAAVERVDRNTADQAFMYPQTGIWIAHVFRRLRGVVDDRDPLWLDVGYLHAVASAAAIRAGLDFAVDVPVRDGLVVLPRLGSVTFPGSHAVTARVEARAGAVHVTSGDRRVQLERDAPDWRPIPMCEAEADGVQIEFHLDDTDPYRSLRGYSAAEFLPTEEISQWQDMLRRTWPILTAQDRSMAESVASSLTAIVPLPASDPYRPLSASCDEAFAGIVASLPSDPDQFAATLVHETQHVRLGALLHLFRFVEEKSGPALYAPWRDDPRPLAGLLQGVYAFIGITSFWRRRDRPVAAFEFALWRQQLRRVLTSLDENVLTADGRALVAHLAGSVAEWDTDLVDDDIRVLADAAAADHYGQWRCYHLPVDPAIVETVVRAWVNHQDCPLLMATPDPEPVLDRGVRKLDARAVLIRMRLEHPESATTDLPAVPGTLPGDAFFVLGDHVAARDSFEAHLADHPGDPSAWLGLGLSLAALGHEPTILFERPELVRAVSRSLAERGQKFHSSTLLDWLNYR